MEMLKGLEGEMDEVLFNSVVDACVRVGRADLLVPFLKIQRRMSKSVSARSAHTYGSIMRAYGSIQDIQGAWDTWEEMKKQQITPISVTLGCMVEALVTNGDIEGGYELIQEMGKDEKTEHLVNAVMYGSIVKGFSHKKCFTRMWQVYDEMVTKKLQFSMVTFNTLIDACARSGDLSRIPSLLKDIESQGLKMGIVTYSAILKGYCQKNMLDEAFTVFHDMTKTAGLQPDEIMYNSLLDGCARQGLYDRGTKLYRNMEDSGVRPSNYTLSVLVKMANRGKRLEKAFELCDELSAKYSFRLNVHVFANLIQACIQHRDLARGMGVLERMLQEGVRPDVRTYSLLLKACIETRCTSDADGLLRSSMGLSSPHARLARFSKTAVQPQGGLPGDLVTEVLQGLADICGKEQLASALLAEISRVPGHRLDPKLRLRFAARMARH
jgi:pentatricopeptide repeat protein